MLLLRPGQQPRLPAGQRCGKHTFFYYKFSYSKFTHVRAPSASKKPAPLSTAQLQAAADIPQLLALLAKRPRLNALSISIALQRVAALQRQDGRPLDGAAVAGIDRLLTQLEKELDECEPRQELRLEEFNVTVWLISWRAVACAQLCCHE